MAMALRPKGLATKIAQKLLGKPEKSKPSYDKAKEHEDTYDQARQQLESWRVR